MATPRLSSSLPATLFRGGTSKALMLHRSHLPANTADWEPILAGAMGSPDPYSRQLNGMGGGVSSLSKVCVIEQSKREEADVDFEFVQLGVKDGKVDMEGTCGNMTSAVGPWAVDEGLSKPEIEKEGSERLATVRIFNTNTNKLIHARFAVEECGEGGAKAIFNPSGDYAIDGVPGTGSRIVLSFLSPGGSKTGRTLPTGNPVDILHLRSEGSNTPASIRASLVDVANPTVFILASDLGIEGAILPEDLDKDSDTMALLEEIRQQGARLMGLDPSVGSIPKIALVSAPGPSTSSGIDIVARTLSMGKTHKAIPLTVALNLGVTCQIPGTLPAEMVQKLAEGVGKVRVGHPSGKLEVGARMRGGEVESAVLMRTARMLMRGEVFWR